MTKAAFENLKVKDAWFLSLLEFLSLRLFAEVCNKKKNQLQDQDLIFKIQFLTFCWCSTLIFVEIKRCLIKKKKKKSGRNVFPEFDFYWAKVKIKYVLFFYFFFI